MEKLKAFMKFAETDMILAAANAMIERSRKTIVPLPVRVFLSFALRLRPERASTAAEFSDPIASPADLLAHSFQDTVRCTTFPTTCPEGECPFRRSGNNCFGMCGLRCNCWRFLCGDCCTHRGCIEHDACCVRGGFLASIRCAIPLGFQCDGRFRCP